MTDLMNQIQSHGYWRVLIRPAKLVEGRISNVTDLFPLVQRSSVLLRGWDFPHIDPHTQPQIGSSWVGQDLDWQYHLERWRLYQSGQFIYLGAFTLDWADDTENWLPRPPKPPQGTLLSVSDAICRYAEFFEFAAALSLSAAGDDPMYISVGCHGIQNRELWLDDPNRGGFSLPKTAGIPEFVQEQTIPRDLLAAETRALANDWAKELFRRFDWDAPDQFLEAIRSQFR